MNKLDPTVRKETVYIALWELIFSLLMEAVFLLIGQWDVTVLLGNLLGGMAAVANFLALGLTVQKVLGLEEKEAKKRMTTSQTGRMFCLFLVAVLGAVLPCFHILATLIPLLFPRIAIALRPLFSRKEKD